MSARYAGILGSSWASLVAMGWATFGPKEHQLPQGFESALNTIFTINFILFLAGGEDVDVSSLPRLLADERARAYVDAAETAAAHPSNDNAVIAASLRAKASTP